MESNHYTINDLYKCNLPNQFLCSYPPPILLGQDANSSVAPPITKCLSKNTCYDFEGVCAPKPFENQSSKAHKYLLNDTENLENLRKKYEILFNEYKKKNICAQKVASLDQCSATCQCPNNHVCDAFGGEFAPLLCYPNEPISLVDKPTPEKTTSISDR